MVRRLDTEWKAGCSHHQHQSKSPQRKKLAQNAADAMECAAKGNISVSAAIDSLRKVAETIGMSSAMPTVKV